MIKKIITGLAAILTAGTIYANTEKHNLSLSTSYLTNFNNIAGLQAEVEYSYQVFPKVNVGTYLDLAGGRNHYNHTHNIIYTNLWQKIHMEYETNKLSSFGASLDMNFASYKNTDFNIKSKVGIALIKEEKRHIYYDFDMSEDYPIGIGYDKSKKNQIIKFLEGKLEVSVDFSNSLFIKIGIERNKKQNNLPFIGVGYKF